ncbi:hypothetical protein Nepgr_033557 [Nepenthes gracilis]|uniref:Uncharacterized protein n=1 Tax=Nepenthes gracilis TaxID=150966 RepID=A0AAD3TKU3_NEPGR|nr:hypothetical protein Nepgr_033557 [Nepenthes gracilis]
MARRTVILVAPTVASPLDDTLWFGCVCCGALGLQTVLIDASRWLESPILWSSFSWLLLFCENDGHETATGLLPDDAITMLMYLVPLLLVATGPLHWC